MADEYEPIGGADGVAPPPPPPPPPAAPIPQPEPIDGMAPEPSQDKPSDYKSTAEDKKTDLGSTVNDAPEPCDDKSKDPIKPDAGSKKKARGKPSGEPIVVIHGPKRVGPRFCVSMCCQRACVIVATVLLALFAVLFILATALPYGTKCFGLCTFIFVPPKPKE